MSHTTFSIVTHSLWLELRHKSAPGDSYLASKLILGLLLCVVLSVAPLRLAAQTTSVIEGTITDPQHLAITGAEITLSGYADRRDQDGQRSDRIVSHPWTAGGNVQLAS